MLMSMIWAPRSMLKIAASAIICASVPAICTAMGSTSPSWLARREVLRLFQRSLREVTISTRRKPPQPLAQLAERTVGHACHGRDKDRIRLVKRPSCILWMKG